MLNALVVDDSELIRTRLAELLRSMPGMDAVDTAVNLAEALDRVDANPPSMLFLDLHLPDGNATQILGALRRRAPAMRIVMLTNDATEFNRGKCVAEGADAFFDKSTELDGALAWVQLLITAQGLARRAAYGGAGAGPLIPPATSGEAR